MSVDWEEGREREREKERKKFRGRGGGERESKIETIYTREMRTKNVDNFL